MPSNTRTCATCGEPLPAQTGRGRPRVAHPGSCSTLRSREVDEARKNFRIREALGVVVPWTASRRDALDDLEPEVSIFEAYADEEPQEPKEWRDWRDKTLATLGPTFAEKARARTATNCLGCPAYDFLLVTTVTVESLIRGREELRQDAALRDHLDGNGIAALVRERPLGVVAPRAV